MVFSADMLLEENYVIPTEMKLMSSNVIANESYFSEALSFINEMNIELNNARKRLYLTMLESGGSESIIHESFSDFKDAIKKIIDKFLDFIKRIASKISVYIHKLVKSDKYIKDNKKKFTDFRPEHEFEMSIYKFTRLDDATYPVADIIDDYNGKNYAVTLQSDADGKITGSSVYNQLKSVYDNITSDSSDFFENFRGKVLGRDGESFTASEFEEELYNSFRDGESSPTKETINNSQVIMALERFLGYDKSIKAVEELKRNLEKEYKKLKNEIKEISINPEQDNSMITTVISNFNKNDTKHKGAYNSDKKKDIDMKLEQINKALISRVETMCSIHSIAFAKKLDAIKNAFSQDKNVLYKALARMTKKPKNESTFIDDIEMPGMVLTDESARANELFEYTNFLVSQSINQNEIIRYIQECVVLENGDLDGLRAINESAIDAIKNIIKKIIDSIKEFFDKFKVGMSKLFTTDKGFLEKYKDVILKKPFKDRDLTIYDYKIDDINKYTVPKFINTDFNDLLDKGDQEFESNFVNKYNSRYFNNLKDSNEDLKDRIIVALRGEDQVETNLQAYENMKAKMYNFCVNIDATMDVLDKDFTTVQTNSNSINAELAKQSRELERGSVSGTKEPSIPDPGKTNTDNTNPVESVFSSVLGTYLHEDNMKIGKNNDKSSLGGGSSSSKSKGTAQIGNSAEQIHKGAVSGAGADLVSKAMDKATGDNDATKKSNAAELLKQYQDFAKNYFNECSKVLQAKKIIIESAYKDYMKILKVHVSDYGGSVEGSTSVIGDGVTAHRSATFGDNNEHKVQYFINIECKNPGDVNTTDTNKPGVIQRVLKLFGRNKDKSGTVLLNVNNNDTNIIPNAIEAAKQLKGSDINDKDIFLFKFSTKDFDTNPVYCIIKGSDIYPINKDNIRYVPNNNNNNNNEEQK